MSSNKTRLRIGRLVAPPAEFQPAKTWSDANYIYRYDSAAGVVKKTSISGKGISGYYAVETVEVKAQPRSKTRFKLTAGTQWLPRFFATVAIVSAGVAAYPLLPGLMYKFNQSSNSVQAARSTRQELQSPASQTNRLIIPKIGVNTPILEGDSLDILNHEDGVWHQTGQAGRGNFVLAGHRFKYLPPNTTTLYNLDKLAAGDTIIVDWNGKRTVYVVGSLRVVPATDVSVLNSTQSPQVTVYSCSDKKETQRVVAVAQPLP